MEKCQIYLKKKNVEKKSLIKVAMAYKHSFTRWWRYNASSTIECQANRSTTKEEEEKMAATLTRRLSGLLRPLSVSLCARTPQLCHPSIFVQPPSLLSSVAAVRAPLWASKCQTPPCSILQRVLAVVPSLTEQPSRSLTYWSLKKGKRKSVKAVTERFMRLHCGLWIRRKAGYKKKLWKKLPARRKRLREIVFCNKTQSKLLDKMTTSFWKRRNWYLNDPYLKYHDRVNL
ncbi:large ribosomal subunit protein bL35m [Pholidichthys leucotaenia]